VSQKLQKNITATATICLLTLGFVNPSYAEQRTCMDAVLDDNNKEILELCPSVVEDDDRDALYALGRIYLEGKITAKDNDKADEYMEKAAEAGSAQAVYWSRKHLNRSIKENNALQAVYQLGMLDLQQGHVKSGLGHITKAANYGHVAAQQLLAMRLSKALYIYFSNEKYDDAMALLEKHQAHDHKQFGLIIGNIFQKNMAEKHGEWRSAILSRAEAGNVSAQYMAAVIHDFGISIAKDSKVAADWYQRASDQGSVPATMGLATLQLLGRGVEKNEKKALVLLHNTAIAGSMEAAFALVLIYDQGGNTEEAHRWLSTASDNGYLPAVMVEARRAATPQDEGGLGNAMESFKWVRMYLDRVAASESKTVLDMLKVQKQLELQISEQELGLVQAEVSRWEPLKIPGYKPI